MNDINALLMASSRTAACNVLIALLILGPSPVAGVTIATTCKIDDGAATRALDVLLMLGLVAHDGTGRYRTNWRLTPAARRLALEILALASAVPPSQYLPAALPLVHSPVDNSVDNPAPDPLYADNPTPLHAGGPAPIPQNAESLNDPSKQGAAAVRNIPQNAESETLPVLVFDKEIEESFNKPLKTPAQPIPDNAELASTLQAAQQALEARRAQSRNSKQARHIQDIAAALLARGRGPSASSAVLPPELVPAADRLVSAVGCPRARAELAVARSPWDAAAILEQIDIWRAYKDSSHGKTITAGGFPFLLAARIEKGVQCPLDVRAAGPDAPSRFDGYIDQQRESL